MAHFIQIIETPMNLGTSLSEIGIRLCMSFLEWDCTMSCSVIGIRIEGWICTIGLRGLMFAFYAFQPIKISNSNINSKSSKIRYKGLYKTSLTN